MIKENDFLEKIIYMEYNFPRLFTNANKTDYGMIFYNEKIISSYDSNHAILNDNISCNYDNAIDEITTFYESKNITPRIYSSLKVGQINKLEKILLNRNFNIEKYNNKWLIKKNECSINEQYTLKIERIDNQDKTLAMKNIYYNEWEYPLLKRKIKNKDYHSFVGYENNIPVTIGAIQYIGDTGRIDDIETKTECRGKGYSRQMVRHLVTYHQEINKKILYLWYNNPTAGKIYREAGFTDFENNFETWSAYKR